MPTLHFLILSVPILDGHFRRHFHSSFSSQSFHPSHQANLSAISGESPIAVPHFPSQSGDSRYSAIDHKEDLPCLERVRKIQAKAGKIMSAGGAGVRCGSVVPAAIRQMLLPKLVQNADIRLRAVRRTKLQAAAVL